MTVTYKNSKMVVITGKGSDQYTSVMPDGRISVSTEFDKVKSRAAFVDVPADAYCEGAVLRSAVNGVASGMDTSHCAADASCTSADCDFWVEIVRSK